MIPPHFTPITEGKIKEIFMSNDHIICVSKPEKSASRLGHCSMEVDESVQGFKA